MCGGPGAAGQVPHNCLLTSVGLGKCSTGVDTARPGLLHHRQRRQRRAPAGGSGEAVRHGCVAGRAQLGRCRTLACWHQWGWASAAQGWTQPGLACCTTGSGGSDEPRQAGGGGEAVRHGCVAGRAQLGRCRTIACWHQWGWASAAQGWTQPGLACCTTGSGGSDEPRQAGGGGEAVRHGCVAGRAQLGRCRTLACWHQWGWASAAQGWAQPGLAWCTTHRQRRQRRAPAGRRRRRGGAARVCGGPGAAGQVPHTCLLASVGLGKCSTGVGTARPGLVHHRQRRQPRAPAGGCGEAVRHGCVAGRAQLGRCRTLACWHQWGWASAAQGWAQPGLACCTTGSGGSDEPRPAAAAARRCGTGVWRAGRTVLLYCVTPVCILKKKHRARHG